MWFVGVVLNIMKLNFCFKVLLDKKFVNLLNVVILIVYELFNCFFILVSIFFGRIFL